MLQKLFLLTTRNNPLSSPELTYILPSTRKLHGLLRSICKEQRVCHFPGKWQPPPHFSAHIYCGQTVGWIKVSLGKLLRKQTLSQATLLDGDETPPKEAQPPNFSAHCSGTVGGRLSQQLLSSCIIWELLYPSSPNFTLIVTHCLVLTPRL